MGLQTNPESSTGILNAIKGSLGLFSDTNKALGTSDNSNPMPVEEYESSMTDTKVLELTSVWKKNYSAYYDDIEKSQDLSYDYWIGRHRVDDNISSKDPSTQVVDNLMFESVETFLPIATRANPDPLVTADPSPQGQEMAHNIKTLLVNEADSQKLRRKLARMTRHWVIYRLGVAKISWDSQTKSIKTDIINPKQMIFDKDGYIDEGGNYRGEYIGQKKKATADKLAQMFPKKKTEILIKAQGKAGTKLQYIEWWWNGLELFYTLDDIVLGKYKNPNWNYAGIEKTVDPETGAEIENEIESTNHLKEPAAPYVFLSVFSTGSHPHDDTSLILQNVSVQDLINRRWRQLDDNIKGMNNGMVVSGTAFTEEQASQAASALRRGVAIRVPNGKVGDAVQRLAAPNLPGDVYNNLRDGREQLRNIFGTSGSTPEGVQQEKSVRGKIMVAQQDTSRIGGGVTEQIEQVADTIYNWWVQMAFVFFDDSHFLVDSGSTGGPQLIEIKNSMFPLLKTLNVTVKEGSLIPKDPMTQRNEAIDLWSANAIDPLSFFKRLDFADPANATQQLILWQMFQKGLVPPQAYLPSFQIPTAPGNPAPVQGGPAVNNLDVGQPTMAQAPVPQSPEAVQAQSQQLLGSVPL